MNCFQILYIRSLNTINVGVHNSTGTLWIAFRFCIFVLWTQFTSSINWVKVRCELLSDFVYSFFEHNGTIYLRYIGVVVNCFQILYIRSLNTMLLERYASLRRLWIAFRFCIFVLWTQYQEGCHYRTCGCELLSDFVYSFFEHNISATVLWYLVVVNCFQILYIRSLNTIIKKSVNISRSCELLSDFVYSFFEHNSWIRIDQAFWVVNCFQILYIRSLNTIEGCRYNTCIMLWIAFRFCIFVLWTQCPAAAGAAASCCELLSDFVYSFFEHNHVSTESTYRRLWIAFRFCIFVLWTQSNLVELP